MNAPRHYRSKYAIVGPVQKTSDILWQDTQHQLLFELLERIAEENSVHTVLSQLHFYAESHFALEECYMEMFDYPGREEHLAAHNKFRVELEEIVSETRDHDATSRQIISTLLTEWLKRHVFGIDKQLEAFLLERGVH
jgi:hemerythrin